MKTWKDITTTNICKSAKRCAKKLPKLMKCVLYAYRITSEKILNDVE